MLKRPNTFFAELSVQQKQAALIAGLERMLRDLESLKEHLNSIPATSRSLLLLDRVNEDLLSTESGLSALLGVLNINNRPTKQQKQS